MAGRRRKQRRQRLGGFLEPAFSGLLEVLQDVRSRIAGEKLPRQGVASAKVVAGARKLHAEHFAKGAAPAVVARHDDRLLRQVRQRPVQRFRRQALQRQVHRAGQMSGCKLAGTARIDEHGFFVLNEIAHLRRVEQHTLVAVPRHRAKLGRRASIQTRRRTALDQPFFQPADQEAAIDAKLRQRLTRLRAAVAVVREQDDGLAGKIDAGRLDVRKAHCAGAGHRTHLGLGLLADIEQECIGVLAAGLRFEQPIEIAGADAARMTKLLAVRDFADGRIGSPPRNVRNGPRQRRLKPLLLRIGLGHILIDVGADRYDEHGGEACRGVEERPRHPRTAVPMRPHGGIGCAAAEDGRPQREQLRNADE